MPKYRRKKADGLYHLHKELEAYRLMSDLGILAASLPQTAFLELSLERIMSLLNFDAGGLYIYDEIKKVMNLEVSNGLNTELYQNCKVINLDEPHIFQEALFSRLPICVDNIYTHRLTKKTKFASKKSDFTGIYVIPIFRHHEILGAVVGFFRKKCQCYPEDIKLYQNIVVPLAHALECSRLFNIITNEKRKLGTILYVLNDGVLVVDLECRINFWNHAAEKITGMKAGEVMGQDCFNVLIGKLEDRKGKKCFESKPNIPEFLGKDFFRKIEGFFQPVNEQKKIFLRLRISPYWQIQGKPSGYIITFEDATSQWEIGRLKEDWRSMLTHDLKTPLTSTFGSLRILSESKNLSRRDKNLVNIGIQAYNQMLDLVNLYLDVEKFNAGKMVIHPHDFSLKPILMQCLKQAEINAQLKRIKLKLLIDKDYDVVADRVLIIRAIENFINNAIKSILRDGLVQVKVEHHDDKLLKISVTDTGIGIAPRDLPFIFDRFYQGSLDVSGKSAGTGLGLTFCKQVIEAHGQDIWVESKLHKGTTFSFTLPRA